VLDVRGGKRGRKRERERREKEEIEGDSKRLKHTQK